MLSPAGAPGTPAQRGKAARSPGGGAAGGGMGIGFTSMQAAVTWLVITLGLIAFYGQLFKGLAGGGGVPMALVSAPAEAEAGACPRCEADPDAWLDTVGDSPPRIVPSHYALVNGIEPFERHDVKPFDLHVIPTDEWYFRAKKATDRCDRELSRDVAGADNGLADKVVWVSGLFDLKRGEAANGAFNRPIAVYIDRFQRILDRGFEMVIFIPAEFEEHLRIDKARIHVVHMTGAELMTYFPYYDRVQAIRTSKLWNEQAVMTGWLSEAPQARLPQYNPLVMGKLMLLRDAAKLNRWGARYHMWMDAGHLCATEQNPTPAGTSMYRRHMSEGFFVTHWPYGTTTEVHGLTDKAMHLYLGTADDPLRIVRGGVFGGTLPQIQCVLRAYVIALHQSLTDGYIGTEECIWAMIHTRLPHLFKSFDNNSLGNHGDNCASFQASTIEERAIASGSSRAFESPAVPAHSAARAEALAAAAAAAAQPGSGGSARVRGSRLAQAGGLKVK